MKRILFLTSLVFISSFSQAGVKDVKPQTACDFLKNDSISTRAYKKNYDGTYGCSSDYIEFDGNNIAYYVSASKKQITQELKLVVNVNNPQGAMQANMFTFFYSNKILEQFGNKAPEELASSIMQGNAFQKKIGDLDLRFVREVWPSGRGYEMKILIK